MALKFNFNELTQYNNVAIIILFIFGMIYYVNSYKIQESMENVNNNKDSKNIEKDAQIC